MTLIVLQESWIVEQTWFPTLIITAEGHLLRIAIAVNIGATLVEKVVGIRRHFASRLVLCLENEKGPDYVRGIDG